MTPKQVLSCECCKFFKNSFFYGITPVALFTSTRHGSRRKCGTKEREKVFQMKEENENISFNFYLQVLVLVKTEMQIQLHNVIELLTLFFSFFLQIFFLVILACSFTCFHPWKTGKYLLFHLLVYSEPGIEGSS